jgi:hypothetical protein
MSQRDTFLPVCKLFDVTNAQVGDVHLTQTGQYLTGVTITDASGWPEGVTDLAVSGGVEVATSAVVSIKAEKTSTNLITTTGGPYPLGQPALTVTASVKTPGAYNGSLSTLGVSGQTPLNTPDADHLDASGVFALEFSPVMQTTPYVTVTDLSGTTGYFRVFPSSADTGLYTSGSASTVLAGTTPVSSDVSGYAGIIGAPGTTVVLTLQPGQAPTIIHIENQLDLNAKFAVNYGVIRQANTLRDQQFPDIK